MSPHRARLTSERPNPRLQRTRAALLLKSGLGERSSSGGDRRAPLSRQPLGARQSTIALFALALAPVLLGSESADLCGRFPEPGFDGPEMRHFAGAYTNPNYGYSVQIPKGLTGYDVPSPSPHHGVGIVLSWEPRAFISVDGSYLTEDITLSEVADQQLEFLSERSQAVLTTRRTPRRLGGLRAQRVISEHTCRSTPGVFVQDTVVAVSGNIRFTLELLTTKDRYAADREVFDRMLSTWRVAKISALAPNPRLQRTRAALLLKSVLGENSASGGDRRAPLSRQPLGPS